MSAPPQGAASRRILVLGLLAVGLGVGVVAARRALRPAVAPEATLVAVTALARGPGGSPWSGDETGRVGPHTGPLRFAHPGPVRALEPRPDGSLRTLGADAAAWFAPDGSLRQRWRLPDRQLNAAVFLSDAEVLVAAERGDVARLGPAGVVWRARAAHSRAAFALALAPDGQEALSAGADGQLIRWGLDGTRRGAWLAHQGWASAVGWPAEGPLSVGSDGDLAAWTPAGGPRWRTPTGHAGPIAGLLVGETRLVTFGADGSLRIFRRADGAPGLVLRSDSPVLAALRDGPWLVSSHQDGRIRRWDVVSGRPGG